MIATGKRVLRTFRIIIFQHPKQFEDRTKGCNQGACDAAVGNFLRKYLLKIVGQGYFGQNCRSAVRNRWNVGLLVKFAREMPWFGLSMIALCALVLVVSARAFVGEYRVALPLNGTTNAFIDAMADDEGKEIQVFGARLARDLMVRCGRTLKIAPRLQNDSGLYARFAASCRKAAEFMIINAPSNPRALTILLVTAPRGDPVLYARAQAASPFEPWSLHNRLRVVKRLPSLAADAAALVDADLRRALTSDWGRRAVAGIYRDSVALRPAITAAAERLPPRDQAAFLDLLRYGTGGAV